MNVANCKYTYDGHNFDLSPLHRASADYFALSPGIGENQFYFNFCGNSIDPKCLSNNNQNAACMTLKSNYSQWYSVGTLNSIETQIVPNNDPYSVIYSMRGADACPKSGNPRNMQVHLTCAQYKNGSIIEETKPQYVQDLDNCAYKFDMVTKHACPTDILRPGLPLENSCTLGSQYSLSALRNLKSNYRVETENDVFWLNMCGPLLSTGIDGSQECPKNASVCAAPKDDPKQPRISLGSDERAHLAVEDGVLTLTYSDGQKCKDGVPRKTFVRFPCTQNLVGDRGGLKIIEGHTACGKTVFEFPSLAGCDLDGSGTSALGVLAWILFSIGLAYLVVRTAFNYIGHGLRGLEVIPHVHAIADAWQWIQDRVQTRAAGPIRI